VEGDGLSEKYDVVVVGAGAGGGVIAAVLAEAGKRVLLLERGQSLSFAEVGRDHLRNQRLSRYGNDAGPGRTGEEADYPRVFVDFRTGKEHIVLPHEGGYSNNAAIVGGGTRVYGGQAWRFHPLDFRMASTYGVPEGSSLADWPIAYEDLAPYYERAEQELGVAGNSAAMTHLPAYAHDYPMPPVPLNAQGRVLRRGLAALGWDALSVPLAVNTVVRDGRPACIQCQHCVGFACPVDAKNGTQNTLIPRAIQTGRCDLVTGAHVESILQRDGRAVGVAYWNEDGERREVRADVVVAAGGAVETARLLLNSGLGGASVGLNLQGHAYPGAAGLFPDVMWDGQGPGVTTATCRWNHGNDGIVGGGMLADEFIPLPISVWKGQLPPGLTRWGSAPKTWMRENFRHVAEVKGPVLEIPTTDSRVSVDPRVRDRWGVPAARLSGASHPETVRTARFMSERAREWLQAGGATEIWSGEPGRGLSGGQHQAGTCRMGDDPATSVVDPDCRVWGHDNLYLGDGSVHVTNGGFNPFLTIMALAYRTAEHIARSY
jgi:choline dehydrogenase-like flavoprotein